MGVGGATELGAQALVRTLRALGVRRLFGIPGVHTLSLWDALADYPDIVPFVSRHEAGATFAADAYARVSGQPGVVSVVPGPGALNAATGVLCAWSDRVPMVVITTEIDERVHRAAIHEGDLEAVFRPFTKTQFRAAEAADIEPALRAAMTRAVEAPAGPVQLLIPASALRAEVRGEGSPLPDRRELPTPRADELTRLVRFLDGLSAPSMVIGNDAVRAGAGCVELVELLGAATFTDVAARGIIPEDHPLAAGLPCWEEANEIFAGTDGMLVLGSRLSEISTLNWKARLPAHLARVDANADELGANYPSTLAIHADPAAVIRALLEHYRGRPKAARAPLGVLGRRREARRGLPAESRSGALHPREVVERLRSALPRDAIVTTDATATEFWLSEPSFPVFAPAGFVVPEVQQTMGFGLPAAVGAAAALIDSGSSRVVVNVTGDGSFQMLPGELATAVSLGRQLTVVIFEDGHYNALRIYQQGLYGREVGTTLQNPDFIGLGRAYGARVWRVTELGEVEGAVREAIATPGLAIIAIAIDPVPLPDRYSRRLEQLIRR